MRDLLLGALAGLAIVALSACVTQLDVVCHYEAGVGYQCDTTVGGSDDNSAVPAD